MILQSLLALGSEDHTLTISNVEGDTLKMVSEFNVQFFSLFDSVFSQSSQLDSEVLADIENIASYLVYTNSGRCQISNPNTIRPV